MHQSNREKIQALFHADTEELRLKRKNEILALKKGDEWAYVGQYIAKIIGNEKYITALSRKKLLASSTNTIHLATVLHEQNFFTYHNLRDLILNIFEPALSLTKASVQDIVIDNSHGGSKYYLRDGKEVFPCWLPNASEINSHQAIMMFQDYEALSGMSETSTASKTGGVAVFKDIVNDAYKRGASDIHLVPKEQYAHVFFRIDGDLIKQSQYIMTAEQGYALAESIAIEANDFSKGKFSSDNLNFDQEGRIEYADMGVSGVDVRLEFIPDGAMKKRLSVVARVIHRKRIEKADFEKSGYHKHVVKHIQETSMLSDGLILISGITGSGKSTLNADTMTIIDQNKRIYTIEDPIEYFLANDNITQHQIYIPPKKEGETTHRKMGFAEYVFALKRGDPNVVNIGEMRKDKDLIDAIFEMSNAGQLVYTTAHINSAFGTYHSLEEVYKIPRESSVRVLLFTMNLKLTKKLCNNCKVEDTEHLNAARLEAIKDRIPCAYKVPLTSFLENKREYKTYLKGSGCHMCGKTGYSGRVPMYEYLRPDVDLIEWINERKPTRYMIEDRACRDQEIGQNRLTTFIQRLKDGEIDTSDQILQSIL